MEGPDHSATPEKEKESCSLNVVVKVTFRPQTLCLGFLSHYQPIQLLVASNPVMGFAPSFQARDPVFRLRPVAARGTLILREIAFIDR